MKKNYLMLLAAMSLAPLAQAEDWTYLGTGTLLDGWVTPGIYYPVNEVNPENYIFEVEIFESTETPGKYKLSSPWTSDKFPFKQFNKNTAPKDLVIDASNPDFVRIAPQESGFVHSDPKSGNWYNPFYISCDGTRYELEGNDEADIIDYGYASTMKDGVITIKANFGKYSSFFEEYDMGYKWSTYTKGLSIITLPNETPAVWTEKGEVTFVDGWITPGYKGNPEKCAWKVKYEELEGTPGLYRLVDPWHAAGCPVGSINTNTTAAYLVVDATDPEVVLIEPQYSGFTAPINGGDYNFTVANDAGMLHSLQLVSTDDIKEYFPSRCDKLQDNVAVVSKPIFGPNSQNVGVQWTDNVTGEVLPYMTRIIFPGGDDTPIEPNPSEERDITLYEGFEGGSGDIKDDWIPASWTEINTPDAKPTQLQLSHNVNNSWWCSESSDMYQDMTIDGTKEMFIHFSYDGDWCNDAAQDEWLVSPEVTLTEDEQLHFLHQGDIFKAFDYSKFDVNTMKFSERVKTHTMKVMITTDGGNSWDELWDWADAVAPSMTDRELWDEGYLHLKSYTIDLGDYAHKSVKIAFRYMRDQGDNVGNSMILDRIVIDHPKSASLKAVVVDEYDGPVRYYDLNGRMVDYNSALPGIYIERAGGKTAIKVIKR